MAREVGGVQYPPVAAIYYINGYSWIYLYISGHDIYSYNPSQSRLRHTADAKCR
jgi:hypothetical protein